jgi:polyisoprenoid-binding protein YceI
MTLRMMQNPARVRPTMLAAKGRAMEKILFHSDAHRSVSDVAEDISERAKLSKFALSIKGSGTSRIALLVSVAANLVVAGAPAVQARRFEFDQRRTEVRFTYKMAFSTQRGRFTKVSGTLDYDEAKPDKSKVNASIVAASLTTGEAIVDDELKGAAFFNVGSSPVIAFRSLKVQADSANDAEVSGEITVNGITKPVMLKVSIKPHDDPALKYDAGARRFVATTRIQRSAFNMTDYQAMVDDDVDIEIDAIARPK